MKHYKSVEFLSIFRMSSLPHKPKARPPKRKTPYWKHSCDGSDPNGDQRFKLTEMGSVFDIFHFFHHNNYCHVDISQLTVANYYFFW